ncbi:MAG: hypothetical protein HC851_15345 [Acaryochloris sp. RU_4_1]|nr:hypothetical protein [Acaryochloris sp. RU_4_1]
MNDMSRQVEDRSASQDAYKVGHIAEESIKDTAKIGIEIMLALWRRRQDQVVVNMNTVEDSVNNVKEALGQGVNEDQLRHIVNAHTSAQTIARDNPDKLGQHQDQVIDRARTQLLMEQNQIGFSQKQSQQLELKQEQKHSHGQRLGF